MDKTGNAYISMGDAQKGLIVPPISIHPYIHTYIQILHLIGKLGPTTASPARYIRFIYNRVILENSIVRAAGMYGWVDR